MKIFTALLGHPVQHYFFALIKKIFLQPLIELKYGTTNNMKIFTYEVLGIKIEKKWCVEFISEIFGIYSNLKILQIQLLRITLDAWKSELRNR